MSSKEQPQIIDESGDKYKYGFVTDIDADTVPMGLNEDIIRLISRKKGEPDWLLDWRLKAYEFWQTMKEPSWAKLTYDKIDYQSLCYYSAPKQKAAPKSLDEVDSELLKTYEKLGIPLKEGVYLQLTGPSYETPAEIRMYRTCGADAVGMSTACETIAARHMGIEVCGISCITNLAAGMTSQHLNHQEVQQTADRVAEQFQELLTAIITHV